MNLKRALDIVRRLFLLASTGTVLFHTSLFAVRYQVRSGTTSANWNSTAAWDSAVGTASFANASTYPGQIRTTDTVIVQNGKTITLNVGVTIARLTIGGGTSGTLNADNTARALTISGNLTIASGATFTVPTSGGNVTHTLAVGGDLTNSGTITFRSGSRVWNLTFNGITSQAFSGGGTNTLDGLTISNTAATVSVNTSFTFNGALTVNANANLNATSGTVTTGIIAPTITNTGTLTFNNLTIANTLTTMPSTGFSIAGTLTVNSGITFSPTGTITFNNGSSISNSGTLTFSGISIAASATVTTSSSFSVGGTLMVNSSANFSPSGGTITMNGSSITGSGTLAFSGLTIGAAVSSSMNFTVNGTLTLSNTLAMGSNTLTMGASATTSGTGDVSGIVRRTTINPNVPYSFGSQFTTISFTLAGTLPTEINVKITIGSVPSWKTDAITRYYDIIQVGGSGFKASVRLRYLDSELNGNTEGNLDFWHYHALGDKDIHEHHNSNWNTTHNWVELNNISANVFGSSFGDFEWTLADHSGGGMVWDGDYDSDWTNPANWNGGVPGASDDVVIPNPPPGHYSPTLPSGTSISRLEIQSGAVLNGGAGTQLTITGGVGAWINNGTFHPGTSTIIFTNAEASMAGETNFYNVTIGTGAELTMSTDNIMRIAGSITNNGVWRARFLENTVEYNGGAQTILKPNGGTGGYYHLTLSNTGTKTLVTTSIAGDFTISGSAVADLTTDTTTITFDGFDEQAVAATTYRNLAISKTSGTATLSGTITVNGDLTVFSDTFDLSTFKADRATPGGTLTLSNGATLKIGGTNTIPSNYSTHSIAATSTIEYAGTDQIIETLNSSQTYGNLIISNAGTKSINSSLTAAGNMTVNSPATLSVGNVTLQVNGNLSTAGTITNNGTIIVGP